MDKKEKSLVLENGQLKPVTWDQKFVQWWYGATEPYILKFADFMVRDEKRAEKYITMSKPKSFPSGVIISTEAACRFVDFIYSQNTDNNTARMAVTKCVCQTALKRYKEPVMKDMALLYLADMQTTMKHTGIKEKFTPIETAQEAKKCFVTLMNADLCTMFYTATLQANGHLLCATAMTKSVSLTVLTLPVDVENLVPALKLLSLINQSALELRNAESAWSVASLKHVK